MASFSKLAFEAVENLWRDYWSWVDGKYDESTATVYKDSLRICASLRLCSNISVGSYLTSSAAYNVFKTPADKKEFAQPEAYSL